MIFRLSIQRFLLYLVIVLTGLLTVMGGAVSAANGEPESSLPPSGVKGVVGAQTGSQVYTSPSSNAFLYVPSTSGATSVTVQEISNQYGNGKLITFWVGYLKTDGSCSTAVGSGTIQDGVNGFSANQTYNIPAISTFSDIQLVPNGSGTDYAVFCVQVTTSTLLGFGTCTIRGSDGKDYSTCYWDVTFRLTTTGSNLLGVYPGAGGDDNATTDALRKGTGYFASTGAVWSEEIAFATPCNLSTGSEPLTFYDMDIPYSQADLYIQLQERSRGSNDAYTNVPLKTAYAGFLGLRNSPSDGTATPLQDQGSGATSYVLPNSGSYSVEKEYKLIFSNVGRNNKIRVRIPYPQINSVITCEPPDVCENIDGDQATRPNGYNQSGNNCIFPAPTCSAGNTTAFSGDNFTMSTRYTNNATISLDVKSVTFGSKISGSPGGESDNIGATSPNYKDFGTGDQDVNEVGTYTIAWSMTYRTLYGDQTAGCDGTLTIDFRPVVCTSNNTAVVRLAGETFSMTKNFRNPNPVSQDVTSVSYSINTTPASTGTASPSAGTIVAAPGNRDSTASSIRIDVPNTTSSDYYTMTWTVVSSGGSTTCTDRITINVNPPTCTVTSFSIGTLDTINPQVTVNNPNYVGMSITGLSYSINNGPSGPYNGTSPSANIVAGNPTTPGTRLFTGSTSTITAPGQYDINWTVNWSVSPRTGTVSTGTCIEVDGGLASEKPYTRFYGNDLVAGGGFGTSCSVTTAAEALGFGVYNNATQDQSTYIGSGSELAIFAAQAINGILSGSQKSRDLGEISFANNNGTYPIAANTLQFGGGFGSNSCANDYFANATSLALPNTDLSTVGSNRYIVSGTPGNPVDLTTGAGLVNGQRIVVYVNGDVRINGGRFGYAAESWPSVSDVPSLYVIASGNIFISNEVTNIDGVLIAQPTVADPTLTGQIYTCSVGNGVGKDLTDLTVNQKKRYLYDECRANRLVVNGALVGDKIHLLRTLGTVRNGVSYQDYAGAIGASVAEVFRFSPELYLTSGGGLPPTSTILPIDSIVSLPPSF